MKKAILLGLLCLYSISYAQKIPVVTVNNKPLGLSSLDIDVVVTGNIATTTYDMQFYNPTNAVLEGSLDFPLGDGFSVSRFALDVNGKLREAVVVDKELGRVAFEAVVRRRVDPALLEKGTGNNYKARIYPIPAKGYKRIVLAYEQELKLTEGNHYYDLPLAFQNELENFDLKITVFDQKTKPIVAKGTINGLGFTPWKQNFTTTVHKDNYKPDTPIRIQIPIEETALKQLQTAAYFYAYTTITHKKRTRKNLKKITLLWDASLSMKGRDFKKEVELLDAYFNKLSEVEVTLITYSNTIRSMESYVVKNRQWTALKNTLENIVYDGGTDYSILTDKQLKGDAILLFTDGMHTLSTFNVYSNTPVFTVNSVVKANHQALRQLATTTHGGYINLIDSDTNEGVATLTEESFQFLGYTTTNTEAEIYPNRPQAVTNDFSMAGKNLKNGDCITLQFGYDGTVTQEVEIVVSNAFAKSDIVKHLWAKEKLQTLSQNVKENKEAITTLGTTYQLVTDYTSLIVLEDVRDYVRYKITPPEELLEEYNRILSQKKNVEAVEVAAADNRSASQRRTSNTSANDLPLEDGIIESEDAFGIDLSSPSAPEIIEIMEEEEIIDEVLLLEESKIETTTLDVETFTEGIPFMVVEQIPQYPGCEDATNKKDCMSQKVSAFVHENFDISVAENDPRQLSGTIRIMTQFTINEEGIIEDVKARSASPILEEEAKRVIALLPRMTPGEQRGKKVSVIYSLPIAFRLSGNGQTPSVTPDPIVRPTYTKYRGKLMVKDRKISTSYLNELREIKNVERAYEYYQIQRTSYQKEPAYFIDVANFFKHTFNHHVYARRIVSNIPEMDGDNYELLKVFGYQMQLEEAHDIAAYIFERILELRPEDSQSYRDLALAYETIGKCQEALDLLISIVDGSIYKNNQRRIFEGVKTIAKNEIKHLVDEYKNDLIIDSVPKSLKDMNPMDVRVVVDWNHNDTDIDLHIIDPNLEECYYSHNKTQIGGRMSQDMTEGFGPEEYTVENAIKGDYFIKVRYYGDRYQKVENPTFMKVTIFKYYGTNKETKETQLLRLTKADNQQIIAKLSF
ncbi:VIT domain-containing protein [uncultured Dokdonia sp.]|uniref:VIT domain-containing protein n=1 Tax=uncultured Dokdonia sp. TaxID=575653 RepID=UPI002626C14E|nr:VIT domain-containing protein [uncultured Dokdonia sp.]